ncbi:MAG TPA: hypothetical protein PLS90_11660 [Candidatus Sumerlaeota bacterium]|nr:hypothetical protein [Candidatus Sumerlaeota bacterium]
MAQAEVQFCYQCGRRIDKTRKVCWYCNAPIQRTIRPDRTCPFCGGVIPPQAVKCIHCKEWLDGRPRPEPAPAQVQKIVFVVDPRLVQAAHEHRLIGGEPVPREIAAHLSPQTVLGIERNDPRLIDQPGVRLLPAPEDDAEVIDAEARPVGLLEGPEGAAPSRALMRRGAVQPAGGGGANLPARLSETPQQVGRSLAATLGRALGTFARWLIDRARPPKPVDDTVDVQPDSRYRICESCSTEILATDNYCYHCGMQYHMTTADRHKIRKTYPSNAGNFALIIVLLGGLIGAELSGLAPPPWTAEVVCGLAAFTAAAAFFRRRTSLSQSVSLALLGASALTYLAVRFIV